jgi:hypothetical protein
MNEEQYSQNEQKVEMVVKMMADQLGFKLEDTSDESLSLFMLRYLIANADDIMELYLDEE